MMHKLDRNTALAKGEAPKKWWEEAMRKGIRFRKALNQKSKLFKTLNAQEIFFKF